MSSKTPVKGNLLERRLFSIAFLFFLLISLSTGGYLILERGRPLGWSASTQAEESFAPLTETEPPKSPPLREIVGVFARNQTFTETLLKHGVSTLQIHQMVQSTRPVYNLARVTASRPYWLSLTPEGDFHDFRYPIDDERYLTLYRQGDQYVPIVKSFPFEKRVEPVSGIINDSLFMAVKDSGEQEQLALDLADIFIYDVDFNTDIQRGDSYRMLVEKRYVDGKFVKYGSIVAASITNQDRTLTGYRFVNESGQSGYYGPDGKSLKKSFLKSPLKFARISSSFSHARMHPILKVVRPHLGVDYAAPAGTPVVAVGAGKVTHAGRSGGSGKMVKIRHTGGYETSYLHLSKIAVPAGAAVSQNQVIGYVGSTGLATGPHLDFRVTLRGKYINPSKVVFPPSPPVSGDALPRFYELRDSLHSQLSQIGYEGMR